MVGVMYTLAGSMLVAERTKRPQRLAQARGRKIEERVSIVLLVRVTPWLSSQDDDLAVLLLLGLVQVRVGLAILTVQMFTLKLPHCDTDNRKLKTPNR